MRTVTGGTNKKLACVEIADAQVMRPISDPVSRRPATMMLRGGPAPDHGIVKTGIAERNAVSAVRGSDSPRPTTPSRGLQDGQSRPGHVVVMRGAGVCGRPAMGDGSSKAVFAINSANLDNQIAQLTDGLGAWALPSTWRLSMLSGADRAMPSLACASRRLGGTTPSRPCQLPRTAFMVYSADAPLRETFGLN